MPQIQHEIEQLGQQPGPATRQYRPDTSIEPLSDIE